MSVNNELGYSAETGTFGKRKVMELCQKCSDNKKCQWVVEQSAEIETEHSFMPYSDKSDAEQVLKTARRGYEFVPENVLDFENISLLINKSTGNCAKKDGMEGCYLRVLYFEPFVKAETNVAMERIKDLYNTKITENTIADAEKRINEIKAKQVEIEKYLQGLKLKTL